MNKKALQLQQLNQKMQYLAVLRKVSHPQRGWIHAIRFALGMSGAQLGKKLSISRQGVQDMEARESEGSISVKTLREAARALNMELVYGFIPIDDTIDALIERRAKEIASEIVLRSSVTMQLEGQGVSQERIQKAIQESADEIKRELPRALWD